MQSIGLTITLIISSLAVASASHSDEFLKLLNDLDLSDNLSPRKKLADIDEIDAVINGFPITQPDEHHIWRFSWFLGGRTLLEINALVEVANSIAGQRTSPHTYYLVLLFVNHYGTPEQARLAFSNTPVSERVTLGKLAAANRLTFMGAEWEEEIIPIKESCSVM